MSVRSDFPQKRPRTDSGGYPLPQGRNHSESSLVASLEAELELQRFTLAQQQASTRNLQVEKEHLEAMLCRISSTWTKVSATQLLAELDAALPQEDFAKEALLTLPVSVDGEAVLQARLDSQRQLLRAKVRAVLRRDRPVQPLSGLHRVVSDFASRSFQLEVACRAAQRAQEEAEKTCEQLRLEVSSLRKSRKDDPAKPYREDVAKLKTELELVLRARTALEESLAKLQGEARVSEERFTASRSFQRLIHSCQALFQRLTELNAENLDLRQVQDSLNDRVAAEVARLRKSDEIRVEAAERQTTDFLRKYEQQTLEKTVLLAEIETLRREQTYTLRVKETEMLLSQREAELEKLKRKLKEKKVEREEMEVKWTHTLALMGELEQKLVSREGELTELKERQTVGSPTTSENSIQIRFSQYREEQTRLRAALRKSESDLSALNTKLTHLQAKLASEKSVSRKLSEDVENTANAYEQAMRQNKVLLQGNKELEGRLAALTAQLQTRASADRLSGSELELMRRRTDTQAEVITAQKAVIGELEGNRGEAQAGVVSPN